MGIHIYADPATVNCRKVIAGLKLIGAPYELVHVDYVKGEHRVEPYLGLNPNASLPAMRDGDFELWESNAILQYAADKMGNETVYPHDLRKRVDINRWMQWEGAHWFPTCYVFLVENCVKPLFGDSPDPAALDAQMAQFHKLAGILDRRLVDREWVASDGPTIADIALAAPVHMHRWQKLPLDPYPNLRRWLVDGVERLPCWRQTALAEDFTPSPLP